MIRNPLTPSKYNLWIRPPSESWEAVYNTSTGNYLVLDDVAAKTLTTHQDCLESNRSETLARQGFLVPESVDEVEAIRYVYGISKQSIQTPMLTIAPTMNCNFGCHYCFEEHQRGWMPIRVREASVAFLRFLMGEEKPRSPDPLSITWFGGEPLMALPIVRDLTARYVAMVEEGWFSGIQATVITNGYSLTPRASNELAALHVDHLQITLDGPERIHDARRFLKKGRQPTFRRIMKNIEGVPEKLRITCRIVSLPLSHTRTEQSFLA